MATDFPPPGPALTPPVQPARPTPPRLSFQPDQLLPVFGEPTRYRLLGLMLDGAPHHASELGAAVGKSRMATSKHLACLRLAGLIEPCALPRDRRATGFRLRPELVPAPGASRVLDFGWCALRWE